MGLGQTENEFNLTKIRQRMWVNNVSAAPCCPALILQYDTRVFLLKLFSFIYKEVVLFFFKVIVIIFIVFNDQFSYIYNTVST